MDISQLSQEERDDLARSLRKLKLETKSVRAKANKPRPVNETRKGRRGKGIGMTVSPDKGIEQLRRDFGTAWVDDPANPPVTLVQCESQLCGRLNIYTEGRWTSRRLGDDVVGVVLQLQDGTQETRKFKRSILSADWQRC